MPILSAETMREVAKLAAVQRGGQEGAAPHWWELCKASRRATGTRAVCRGAAAARGPELGSRRGDLGAGLGSEQPGGQACSRSRDLVLLRFGPSKGEFW